MAAINWSNVEFNWSNVELTAFALSLGYTLDDIKRWCETTCPLVDCKIPGCDGNHKVVVCSAEKPKGGFEFL